MKFTRRSLIAALFGSLAAKVMPKPSPANNLTQNVKLTARYLNDTSHIYDAQLAGVPTIGRAITSGKPSPAVARFIDALADDHNEITQLIDLYYPDRPTAS